MLDFSKVLEKLKVQVNTMDASKNIAKSVPNKKFRQMKTQTVG